MLLMLTGTNPSRRLKRVVRDEDGEPTGKTYEFAPGLPIEVADADIESTPSLQKDIRNKVLLPVERDEATNKPVILEVEVDEPPKPKKPKPSKKGKAEPPPPPSTT